jgi:phosphohistidine phosphatase SixA
MFRSQSKKQRVRPAGVMRAVREKARLAWLMPSLVLAAAAAGCGGGDDDGDVSAFGDRVRDRQERTTATPPAGPLRGERLVSELRDGGYVIYLRHTATDWTEDDQHPVDLSDCDTQRNLSAAGRSDARAIGEAIETLEIPVGRVLSSPFCRALDTGELAFGRVESEATLENLESAESEAVIESRTDGLRRLLDTPPAAGTNSVLSGHGYNIQAIAEETGTTEGDADIFRPERGDGFALVATLTPAQWGELAESFGGHG